MRLFFTDFQALAGADHVGFEVVPGFELLDGGVVAAGYGAEVVAVADFVVDPGGALGGGDGTALDYFATVLDAGGEHGFGLVAVDGILHLHELGGVVEGEAQDVTFSRDYVLVVLGVKVADIVDGDAEDFAYLGEVEVAVDAEGIDIDWHGLGVWTEAVLVGVVHGVHGAYHGGDVAAGFAGEVFVDGPEVAFTIGTFDGFVDVAGAAVVGRYGQRPVPEDAVGVLEVAGGGIGRGEGIHALVDVGIDLEAVAKAGAVHELPDAFGAYAGFRTGVHGAFDYGDVLELQREVVATEGLLEDGHVVVGQAQDLCHTAGHFLRVEDHVVLHGLVVGEADEGVHVTQATYEGGVRDVGGEADGVHVVLLAGGVTGGAVHVPGH